MKKEEMLLSSMGYLEDDLLMEANEYKKTKRRIRKSSWLIAAAIVAMLGITASAAYYFTHERTAALMESGPHTGGNVQVELDDNSRDVIEQESRDYILSATDNGVTVSLDSIMGFHSKNMSVVYLTMTLTPPEGTEFTAGIQECGFWENWMPQFEGIGGDASQTAIWNEDGTISVMVEGNYQGDVNGLPMHLSLGGFGNVSKEVASALYSGEREIELPGTWDFEIDALELSDPMKLDSASLGENTEVYVSDFGGYVVNAPGGTDDAMQALKPELENIAPEIDWDHMTLEQLNWLRADGSVFTDEQDQCIETLLADYDTGNYNTIPLITLIYPDGTEYEANSNVWFGYDEARNAINWFLFDAPQDLAKAEHLMVNGNQLLLKN